ncbi:uncharacterized protein [Coffea arabica]|uniref:G-patch domain-containing protein n=1 Tax=Coffea arabica TaxID=13443 RepID=A0ABM4VM59_COFAR
MSTHPEPSDRPVTTSSTDLANLGAQLNEVLNRFNELSIEVMAQRRVIDQLVASGASAIHPRFRRSREVEAGESSAPVDKNLLKRLDRFEEFIRKSQGVSKQGGLDYNDLCLFPDMQLPVGFKAPKFTKYDGTGNPKTHLRMFANKLGRPIDDENLPVRLFPESLEGDVLDWYSNLKPEDMRSWMDLSTAFVRQYEYNCELAPTRTTLEGTKRKPSEDHKTYEKRWRKLAAKVEPPMSENEIVRTFIKARDPPYFKEIFRMTGCSFAEIVNKLEKYDEFIRAGKIVNVSVLKSQLEAMQSQSSSSKKSQFKKKDEEISFVWNQGRPVDQLYEQLKAAGKIATVPPKTYSKGFPIGYNPQSFCAYHSGAPGHSTANCWALKHELQDMIESGDIVLRRREEQGPNVSKNPLPTHKDTVGVITIDEEIEEATQFIIDEAETVRVIEEPFILEEETYEVKKNAGPFILEMVSFECEPSELVVLELPEQPPILNPQEVPWNYSEPTLLIGGEKVPRKEVDAITRSRRIIGEPIVDEPSKAKEHAVPTKPIVTDDEAFNFLKMLKKSEYKVVEQLDKMPAQVSILNLLLTSELHREALLKVLTEAQVPKNIPVDKFTQIVKHVLASNQISFSDEDLTPDGIGHNKALYILVRCNGKLLPREAKLRQSAIVVRGFDGAKRESKGEVDLVLEIGPAQFQVMCQVMDFSSVYNALLGRPWIHTSGAIPSSLHQMLRFVVNGQLIMIFAEEDCTMIVNPALEDNGDRKALVSHHHVVDIVSVGRASKDKAAVEMNLPESSIMMAKELIRGGYEIGKGLGRNLQGVLEPIELQGKKDTFGLGFQPTAKDKKEMMNRKRAEKEGKQLIMSIPPLYCIFPYPSKVIRPEVDPIEAVDVGLSELFVGVVAEEEPLEDPRFPEVPIEAMKNWTSGLLPSCREFRSYDDMPGISTDIVVHRLPTDPNFPPILMAEEDREKTAFITPWGTFCYRVMPFGLKNAGATYQRTMTTLFHDMIHKEMEVYVDDIIIKSERAEDHLVDLERLFERLRKYDLKLNPAKCAFGAPAGKLLGFIVSKKGIEIDPAKIKAIREMPVPRTQKDVKSFLRKINFIGRFMAQLTHTCEPLFKLLKKNAPLHWSEECQQAFDKIKDYLLHPPVLVPPKPG